MGYENISHWSIIVLADDVYEMFSSKKLLIKMFVINKTLEVIRIIW